MKSDREEEKKEERSKTEFVSNNTRPHNTQQTTHTHSMNVSSCLSLFTSSLSSHFEDYGHRRHHINLITI